MPLACLVSSNLRFSRRSPTRLTPQKKHGMPRLEPCLLQTVSMNNGLQLQSRQLPPLLQEQAVGLSMTAKREKIFQGHLPGKKGRQGPKTGM